MTINLQDFKLTRDNIRDDGLEILSATLGITMTSLNHPTEEFQFELESEYRSGQGYFLRKIKVVYGYDEHANGKKGRPRFRVVSIQGAIDSASFNAADFRTKMAELKNLYGTNKRAAIRRQCLDNADQLKRESTFVQLREIVLGQGADQADLDTLLCYYRSGLARRFWQGDKVTNFMERYRQRLQASGPGPIDEARPGVPSLEDLRADSEKWL